MKIIYENRCLWAHCNIFYILPCIYVKWGPGVFSIVFEWLKSYIDLCFISDKEWENLKDSFEGIKSIISI